MARLIEQKMIKPSKNGGSLFLLVPSTWVERLQITEETDIQLRLSEGKFGEFIDAFVYKFQKEVTK